MRHWIQIIFPLLILIGGVSTVHSQSGTAAAQGDPPIAALISISQPDSEGVVTLTGAPGAVFPGAQVAVRNLYTGEVAYIQAGITGSFVASLYGPGNTPFHISPAANIPQALRERPGSLPGGPGTIIYAPFPEASQPTTLPTTQIVLDGVLDDWDAYSSAQNGQIFSLRNTDSIYIGLESPIADYSLVRVRLTNGSLEFMLTVNPRTYETGIWAETAPSSRDLGTIAIGAEAATAVEMRIPLQPIVARFAGAEDILAITQIAFLDNDGNLLDTVDVQEVGIPAVEEQDGIVYPNSNLGANVTRFSVSGTVAQGASRWHGRARLNSLTYSPGERLQMEMDVMLAAPDLPETLTSLAVIGRFGLSPVANADGIPVSGAIGSNNGWSGVLTDGGLAIENLSGNFSLGDVRVAPSQVIRRGDNLLFGFAVDLPVPGDLPAGTYVPTFEGRGQIGNGESFSWAEPGLLGAGESTAGATIQRLPVVLNIGTTPESPRRLLWTLFQDVSSNGSRGIIAEEDRTTAALTNRVKFNSPTFIIPPATRYDGETITRSIEPSLISMLPNTYNRSAAPLAPLLFPGGRISANIVRPDGSSEGLPNTAIVQNTLSTTALDERNLYGENSQVDVYRVTTLDDSFTNRTFDQYGEYTIELTGFVEDVWGNRYEGGGTYNFLVAELLALSPAMLPGTSLQAGDTINPGLHISPGVAADITARIRIFPLKGEQVLEQVIEGQANAYGVFQPEAPFLLEVPGEYIIDYEARFTDADGRLWAGSLRSAGIIGRPGSQIVARGQRGMANAAIDRAWYLVEQASAVDSETAQLYMPYFSGDIAWVADASTAGITSALSIQDITDRYANWLAETHANFTDNEGTGLSRLTALDALPANVLAETEAADNRVVFDGDAIASESYAYFSYVHPNNSVRQFILGSENGDIPLELYMDDPLNQQIGAGADGLRAGDYFFMFGGALLRNDAADLQDAAIYASLGVVIDEDDDRGARVLPPFQGATNQPEDGTLLVIDEQPINQFFLPTGVRPGSVLAVGDILSVTGQVAPTLASDVSVEITSPSGNTRSFAGTANAIGYFYTPVNDFAVDEPGVWTVKITTEHSGLTSAGIIEPSTTTGSVPGAANQQFNVYVVAPDAPELASSTALNPDSRIPPGFPFNFSFTVPEGWTEVTPYITATLPGQIVQDSAVSLTGSTFSYQYNPTAINQQFPFFEGNDNRLSGEASSDPLTLTFVMTGLNASGEPDIAVRHVVIRHDRLITLD